MEYMMESMDITVPVLNNLGFSHHRNNSNFIVV